MLRRMQGKKKTTQKVAQTDKIVAAVAQNIPQLARGQVWCRRCGQTQRVDSATALREGWPRCCGVTMTIDSPAEQEDFERRPPTITAFELRVLRAAARRLERMAAERESLWRAVIRLEELERERMCAALDRDQRASVDAIQALQDLLCALSNQARGELGLPSLRELRELRAEAESEETGDGKALNAIEISN